MKQVLTLMVLTLASHLLSAQNDQRIAQTKTSISEIEQVVMPAQDNNALLATEMQRRGPGIAPRFAVNLETDISPLTHGNWESLPNGKAVWRLRIFSEGAKSLNLGFTKYNMPSGGSLILYSPDQQRVMGPFTPADNEEHEQLWTPVLDGDELVIEVQVPIENQQQLELELKYVNHDFIGFSEMASGSCNLDVICGLADGWGIVEAYRDIIQSVAVIGTGGGTFCTGFLVNNARQDCTPYFMTANHCGINNGNAASLVTYWNFFNSTCRQPNSPQSGGNGNGSLTDFNTGSIFRAGWGNSDFTLVELDDPVSPTADAFFAGWSAEDFAPTDTVIAIHHPSTDEKRISFEYEPTFVSNYLGAAPIANGNHITVEDWDIGTTEGGSSGSPLFNRLGRVVGQLHGGFAACGNNDLDSYGWFHSSWEGGGSVTTRLRDWLDPDDTGVIVLDGRADMQCQFTVVATPPAIELCVPDEAQFAIDVSVNFQSDVSLTVNGLPMELTATFADNPVMPDSSTILTIGNTSALPSGSYQFTVIGTDGTESSFSTLTLAISNGVPDAPNMTNPADGETGIGLMPVFTWNGNPNASYSIEIATDLDFTDIIMSGAGLSLAEFQATMALLTSEEYFWRVKGENVCGEGDWSNVRSFTTAAIICGPTISTDVPKPISASGTPTVTSTLEITSGGLIDDVNVNNIEIAHTWVSDVRIELTSPAGTTIQLMDNVGGGNCQSNNALLNFDDQAANTYADLDAMCNQIPPALEGAFQPNEALSAFVGEQATGTWTLRVFDDVNQDGGSLNNWALGICTIIPNDFSVTPSANEIVACMLDTASFSLLLGGAFDGTNGVSLSANNLPPGAVAVFDPNPAAPASEVSVNVFGAASAGVFDIEILADDGTDTGTTQVEWTLNAAPDAPVGVFPAPDGMDIPINLAVLWTDAPDATSYNLLIATDPDMNSVFFSGFSPVNSMTVSGLEYCTTYYWQVIASGDCGESGVADTYSFITETALIFEVGDDLESCNIGEVTSSVAVDGCYESTGVQLSASGLPAGMSVNFPVNPVFSGNVADVELTLDNVAVGSYTITIEGSDGVNAVSAEFTLQVIGPATEAEMTAPADAAVDVSVAPTFTWNAVAGATGYLFELATDDGFTDLVYNVMLAGATYTLPSDLDPLTIYYWRVTAINDCGSTTAAPFSFETMFVDAVVEVNGFQVEVLPNPTSGILNIRSSGQLQGEILVDLYSINGIHLMEKKLVPGIPAVRLDLMDYPAGVYLLRLKSGDAVVTERIILEK